MEKKYHVLQNIAYCIRFYQKNAPAFLWLSIAEILFGAAQPLFGIWLPKLVIDLVTQGVTVQRLWLTLGVFGLLCMCIYVVKSVGEYGKYFIYNTKRNDFMAWVFLKSLRIPYSQVEQGETKELYWKAIHSISRGDWSALYRMSYATSGIVQNLISFALYSTVLSFLNPMVAGVLLAFALTQYIISILKIRYMERFRGEEADLSKKRAYLFYNAMGNQAAAKDVRIFGMKKWLGKEKEILLENIKDLEKRKSRVDYFSGVLNNLLCLGRDIFAYVYLLKRVSEGTIGAGDFVLYFGAVAGFSAFVGSIMNSLADLQSGSREINLQRSYLEMPEEELYGGNRHISELAQPLELEFRDVSFSKREERGK